MELEKIRQKIVSVSPDRVQERLKMFQSLYEKLDQGGEDAVKNYLSELGGSIQKKAEELEIRALGSDREPDPKSLDREGNQ